MNISINSHSSVQIENLYFDPFNIAENMKPAKFIFITHPHYDHLSIEDIKKVCDKNTIFVATQDSAEKLKETFSNQIIIVKPNQSFDFDDLHVETFASFNTNKNFHRKEFGWVGFKVTLNNTSYAVVGDTDATDELSNLSCDVLFLPIGGTYTMNAHEAAELANKVKPKLVIPTHYNAIVGDKNDEKGFLESLDKNIEYKILIK